MKQKPFSKSFSWALIPFKKTIATFLILLLIISQTFRWDFLGTANANAENYRDIVSIVVDQQTRRALGGKIDRYAEDISTYLGSTRVVISVINPNTTPAEIAAYNEKLYYEGDGENGVKSRLVGTILIGNVPIPMVNVDWTYFPSIFPYADFENKAFVYNSRSDRYEQVSALNNANQSVEIWHGVINPAVGRTWNANSDIVMIGDFLDKTHDFYAKQGKFANNSTETPKVFYFDGFAESLSIDPRAVFQYGLWIQNVENLVYKRFSKYLLTDINNVLRDYDAKNNSEYVELVKSLGVDGVKPEDVASNTLSEDLIKSTPDIHTAPIIENLLEDFAGIFNTKILGEELAAIHNAGRYNSGGTVNADLGATQIAIVDEVAANILKKANDALEESFTEFLKENNQARKIAILDGMTAHFGVENRSGRNYGIGHTKGYENIPYKNYFFGTEGKNIASAAQCSIARGTNQDEKPQFGKSVLVEANAAFDINSTQKHSDILKPDAANCYAGSNPVVPQLGTFWGGNSLLRVATYGEFDYNPLTQFPDKRFTGFVKDIFSTGGMLESDRLPAPSLAQCMDYTHQYTVKEPHSWQVAVPSWRRDDDWRYEDRYYPTHTDGKNFRCNSEIDIVDGVRLVGNPSESRGSGINIFGNRATNTIPLRPDANFLVEAARYSTNTECLVGALTIDGHKIENNNSCIYTYREGGSDDETYTVNNTNYRNLNYHTIDGILYHISPTNDEIATAENNGTTPSLAININRSVEFLTKKGNIAKIQYPNFFRANAKTVEEMRAWLKSESDRQWNAIFETERNTAQSDFDANISENILGAKNLQENFDWNNFISDELITQIIQAKNWLHSDITTKYQDALESMLSYSHSPKDWNIFKKIPETSANSEKFYEIAYLGLSPIIPRGENESDNFNNLLSDYTGKISAIQGLNITDSASQNQWNSSASNSAQCGPIDGVDLFKWPGAVQCWIKSQLSVKISAGQCGGSTIGHNNTASKPTAEISHSDVNLQKTEIAAVRVIPHFSRTHTSYFDALSFTATLENDNNRIIAPNGTTAKLKIISATSEGKNILPADFNKYFEVNLDPIPAAGSQSNFIISTKDKSVTITAQIAYSIMLADGTYADEKLSENFTITVSSAYLDSYLSTDNSQGEAYISADRNEKFYLNVVRKESVAATGKPENNFSVKILDDISGREIIAKIDGKDGKIEIPATISKNIGVYRAIITGADGISGEMTFSVRAGELAKISLNPVSSAIVKDSETLVTLSLQDALNNAVSADLFSVELTAENGSLVDISGNSVQKLTLDIFDSHLIFGVRGNNSGKLKIFAKVKQSLPTGDKNFETNHEIDVIERANVKFQIDGNSAFQIGDAPRAVRVVIADDAGKIIEGFSSILSISVPSGAGEFSHQTVAINRGQSENLTFYPGTVAGQHNLTLNIPGIGILNNTPLTILPGKAMYIDSSATNGQVSFALRDRYGNVTADNFVGFLTKNSENPVEIRFENGKYNIPEENGFYIIEVPEIANNIIYYNAEGKILANDDPLLAEKEKNLAENKLFQILPAHKYVTQIFSQKTNYDFRSDYNARYTVLAGGSFLREAEDILFHADKNNSQGLAATTLLDSPLAKDVILSVFPGGGFRVGATDDAVFETNLEIERGFPVVHIRDSVRKNQVAKISYQLENATLKTCKNSENCETEKHNSTIIGKSLLDENLGYSVTAEGGKIFVKNQNEILANFSTNGSVEISPNTTIRLKSEQNTAATAFEIFHNGGVIAEILYHFDERNSVQVVDNIFANISHTGPVMETSGYQIENFSDKTLGNASSGILLSKNLQYDLFDPIKTGPSAITDIGTIAENAGAGWMDNNRMMLSFAAGDTVGESTKWFHTYMMINIGDPVATVDIDNKNAQTDGIDRSIGTQIADSRKTQIENFFERDMNADGFKDILVFYADGYVELLLNINGKFRNAGKIAYLPKVKNSLVEVADFQGDKFSDIISLNQDGTLSLISNNDRKFAMQEIAVEWWNPPIHVQQMKVYDMDADGKDDLVYLTSGGELGILYGTETPGKFLQKILDSTLGITLNPNEIDIHGGALKNNFVNQVNRVIGVDASNVVNSGTGVTDEVIKSQVFYQRQVTEIQTIAQTNLTNTTATALGNYLQNSDPNAILNPTVAGSIDNAIATNPVKLETFVRSQYASLAQANVEKKYTSKNNLLYPDDIVEVTISLKNNSAEVMKDIVYLDTITEIFAKDNSANYEVEIDGKKVAKNFVEPEGGEYDLQFEIDEIPANSEAKIRYTLKVLPASYGEMLVGDFEKWTPGHDRFGDIAFAIGNTCGAEKLTWFSDNNLAREYQSSKLPAMYSAPLPNGLAEKIQDSNSNGTPDYVENMTADQSRAEYEKISGKKSGSNDIVKITKEDKRHIRIGFDAETEKKVAEKAQEIADGLSCGFGGGSCMSFPINWAPLAPGNDPVVMGSPVGNGFKTSEWLPFFSALTGINVPTTHWCYQVPTVWPASIIKFTGSCNGQKGAGWSLGDNSPTNFVRLYATPTLTLGMGAAVCLGGPANVVGGNPGKGLSPLVQGWNCIVMAKAMPVCKGDGSVEDGDISGISGLGIASQNRAYSTTEVWNGQSCNLQASSVAVQTAEEKELEKSILDYMRSPDGAKIAGITAKISKRSVSSLRGGPLINIGNTSAGADFEVSVKWVDSIADIGKVVEVNNKRIAAFPDFIMNWLTRQTEELTNSLFTPPNLTIIPPTNFGQNAQVDSSYANFMEELQNAYSAESARSLGAAMAESYKNTDATTSVTNRLTTGGNTRLGGYYENMISGMMNNSAASSTVNSVGGGINAMKTAYTFLGKLPFLNIRETNINVNVPWILPAELDQYERKLKSYKTEIDSTLANWCANGDTPECLQAKANLDKSGFISSLNQNLKRLEEYRRFPEKLQKYVTWKEKLLYDLLCNIQAVEKMTFGWVKDNGVRFQKWAELYVLIKAIAESWQPLLDIFAETNASCGVCRNERHNSQAWKFKLISAIIPQIPVISFPKWPDIVLDLSDVRLGIDIALPNFNFRISPVNLPNLPNLSLPNSPNANFSLPTLPVLPALPTLPDLPELPSLPMVKLPDLPPPPKLPKIGGSIKVSLDILKLISKLYCYYQKTVLIPEWQVGDVIAQRTERQTSLPMDFLDVQFPQFSLPTIKEIRVSTHLNYTLRSDFISEFAKKAVEPINSWSTNLQNAIPSNIQSLENAANSIENAANNVSNSVENAVNSAENANRDINNSVQRTDSNFREIENNLQNSSDNIENSAQQAVDNAAGATSYRDPSEILAKMTNVLDPIIAKLESEKDTFLDVDEFANYFKKELVSAGFARDAYVLDGKLRAAKIEAEKLQKEIEDFNREKFDLMYKFIDAQEEQNAKLQNIVDLLKSNDKNLLATHVGNFASEEKNLQKSVVANVHENNRKNISAYEIGKSLDARAKRIAQFTNREINSDGTTTEIETSNPYATGYLPKFEGMYILTETQNIQTKLFDYTELIADNDRVDVVDIDNDGDKDYIFVLGGTLYVKNTYLTNPTKIIDGKITLKNIENEKPEVANNFDQMLSTPSELNMSFVNTVPNEKEWRLEFFDKYLEWDKIAIDNDLYNSLARTTVDLVLNSDFGEFQNGMRQMAVARYLNSGFNDQEFVLEWPQITKLENNIFISISPNRTLYTGKNPVDISYRTALDSTIKNLRLEPHTAYQFELTTEIRTTDSPLYIIGGGTEKYRYSAADNLDGVPVLPWMKISSEKNFTIYDTTHRENIALPANSLYTIRSLGLASDRYNITLPYQNGYYYARLSHLSRDKNDRAGVVLISPQTWSDETPPVITLPELVRMPVYARESYQFSAIISELSKYSVTIDVDTSVDADGNGIYDDDFVTESNSLKILPTEIEFGPFDVPGDRNMVLRVQDEQGNTSVLPLTVQVFTPIPTLENISADKAASGILDTIVENEPVDLFRIRSSYSPIMINSGSILTNSEGRFASGSFAQNERIVVSTSGESWTIADSGIFENLPNTLRTTVTPATLRSPMSINVLNAQNEIVYQQFMSLPRTARIVSLENASQTGNLVILPNAPYNFVAALANDSQIPGGAYITDADHNAIIAVNRDGNIYTLNNDILLSLSEKDGYILVTAIRNWQKVADFHYQMKFFYTTK